MDNVDITVNETIENIVINPSIITDLIDFNLYPTVETVNIAVTPNLTTVNINSVTGGGAVTSVNGQTGDVVLTIPTLNDATTTVKGIVKLAGDLAGTADLPTVPNKVDKVAGKGLSTNDFTNILKTKLDGIADGAEVNVNADWNATSGDAQILNKPTIPTQTSQLTNNGADGTNPFITALDIPIYGQASTLVREVKNMTGATLTKGTVVYISGANGNKALVSKALATTDALSARTFGLLQSNISNNGLGYCVIIGDLSGLDTSAFTEGAQLYLSGVTAGTYTATKTLAPTHLVYVGKVTRAHPTQGQIEVGIQNGYELEEIHDVQISSLIDKQLLSYDLATDLWKNKSVTTADISDSTGKRYQTDNQNSFNDATSSIQTQLNSKQSSLGYTPIRQIVKDSTEINLTGTIVNTIISSYLIPSNTFASNDCLKLNSLMITHAGVGSWSVRVYINSTLSLTGAVQIATTTTMALTSLYANIERVYFLNNGNFKGFTGTSAAFLDYNQLTTAHLNTPYNVNDAKYLIITIVPAISTDTFTQHGINITN